MTDLTEARIAAIRENVLMWRLSIYASGVANLAGILAAVLVPTGYPWATWLVVTGLLCTAFALGIGDYVGRRGDD